MSFLLNKDFLYCYQNKMFFFKLEPSNEDGESLLQSRSAEGTW